jgi:peroxiredoxin family protein
MADKLGQGSLALIVLDGSYERVHYALAMAASAAAIGRKVILFFTNHGLHALMRTREGAPGWHRLRADADGRSAHTQDQARIAAKVGGFDELLAACVELGARLMACEMGLRNARLSVEDLRPDLPIEVSGLVTLYADMPADCRLVLI